MNNSNTENKHKIFVIEDNRTEGMLLRLSLTEMENIEIIIFQDAESMIKRLHENPVIVIADLMLPDMSGFDLIKQIKAINENIRIIVVSAQRNIDLIAELQAEGIYNYLVKSEACLNYLKHVIEDLLIVVQHKQKIVKND